MRSALKLLQELLEKLTPIVEAEEPKRGTKTRSKVKDPEVNLNRDENFPDLHKKVDKETTSSDPKLSAATAKSTSDKLKNVKLDDASMAHLLSLALNMPAERFDDVGEIEFTKPTPNTLPKVISTAMRAAGTVDPEFHAVKNLPGYMSSAIRQLGKAVFAPFTSTPIADIQVIANLNGSGPNDDRELNAVADFVRKHGTAQPGLEHQAELIFDDVMPGYRAKVVVRTFANYTFMVVVDHAGKYIYAWPSSDNKKHVADKTVDKLLKHLH